MGLPSMTPVGAPRVVVGAVDFSAIWTNVSVVRTLAYVQVSLFFLLFLLGRPNFLWRVIDFPRNWLSTGPAIENIGWHGRLTINTLCQELVLLHFLLYGLARLHSLLPPSTPLRALSDSWIQDRGRAHSA